MTWLTPLFLAAGIAVAGPILFHMWQRTPRGRRLFSSTMFLAPSPPRITQRSKIENWLLLCLRALALILIAVAFARPVWRSEEQAPTVNSPDKTIAVLVDTSASLQRTGFWEALQKDVAHRIDGLPAATHLGLFAFDHRWRKIVPFDEADGFDSAARRELVKERLSAVKPGWGSTRLGNALAQTMQAMREFGAARPVKEASEIWLVSDLASGADLTGLAGIDWPETTRLEIITPDVPAGTNAGLQWIDARNDVKESRLRVRITNGLKSLRDRFELGWENAGETVTIHVPAGQSRTILAPEHPADLSDTVALRLTGDDHDFDNRLWSATNRRREVWVLYLGSDTADDVTTPRFFLQQALAGTADVAVTVKSLGELDEGSAQVDPPVFVVWTDAGVEPPGWLRGVLERGAGLLAVPQTVDDAKLMSAYQQLDVESIAEAPVKDFSLLTDIDFEDPLFATFIEARFADFSGIHFWKHRRIKLTQNFPERVLARFDDGDPCVIHQTIGAGRTWMLTSGWHPVDSQLARSSKFAPLLQRMLEQSTELRSGSSRGVIGGGITWPLSRGDGAIAIDRPDGTTARQADPSVPFVETDLPGIYRATRAGETASWAVNVAPEESKTDPLAVETLERFGVVTKRIAADGEAIRSPIEQRQLQLEELERRQSLWRWCLLAAGGCLILETLMAARKSHIATLPSEVESHDIV